MRRLDVLTPEERVVIHECLRAAVEGPFFHDSEFHTLFGLNRDEVAEVLRVWPDADDGELQDLAVNNSMNNLLGYPHREEAAFGKYISVPREEVRRIFRKWRGAEDRA